MLVKSTLVIIITVLHFWITLIFMAAVVKEKTFTLFMSLQSCEKNKNCPVWKEDSWTNHCSITLWVAQNIIAAKQNLLTQRYIAEMSWKHFLQLRFASHNIQGHWISSLQMKNPHYDGTKEGIKYFWTKTVIETQCVLLSGFLLHAGLRERSKRNRWSE